MYQVIIVIHVLLGLGIIGLIMIQQGKGADAGATFGAGASGSVFGAQGAASFLSKTTATMAACFFITSLGLAVLNSKQGPAYDLMSNPLAQNAAEKPVVELDKPMVDVPIVPESTSTSKDETSATSAVPAMDGKITEPPAVPATNTKK